MDNNNNYQDHINNNINLEEYKPLLTSNQKISIAEKVIGKKVIHDKIYYKVKWKDRDYSTWEPVTHFLNSLVLIDIYEEENKKGDQKLNKKRRRRIDKDKIEYDINIDKPKNIIQFFYNEKKKTPLFEIEWKIRENLTKPKNSYMTLDEVTSHYPKMFIKFCENNAFNISQFE